MYASGFKRKHALSKENDNIETVESKDDASNEDENFLTSITNEDGDSSDDDEAVVMSDEEDDRVMFESDDEEDEEEEEEGSEDSGASSLEDQDSKDGEETSDSDYSEYGSNDDENAEEESEEDSKEQSEDSEDDVDGQSKLLRIKVKEKNSRLENDKSKKKGNNSTQENNDKKKEKNSTQQNNKSKKKGNNSTKENNKDNSEGSTSKTVQRTNKKNADVESLPLNRTVIQQRNDEYDSDSSDEEDIRNTVGNIPMNWYDEYKHLGYDWEGKKIMKPVTEDELDNFLKRMEDPNFWRTVRDKKTGQDVVLSDQDVELIRRLQAQKIPDEKFNDTEPWIEWFTSEVMQTPIVRVPEHKRSFLPSKMEARKVAKMVHAIKMGWVKPAPEKPPIDQPNFYMLWETDEGVETMRRIINHIPAPKRHLPGHAESYNPPPEYLFDDRERKLWDKMDETPWNRKLHFVPQKYSSLRLVPTYENYVKERFDRCLDLFMCPRARKWRLTIEPEDLLPQLPDPKDLQPFPTTLSVVYEGHTDMVRSIAVEPHGQYLISGSDDLTIKVWEIATGRCVRTIPVGGVVRCVSWCPSRSLSLVAVAADRKVLLVNPGIGDSLVCSKTDSLLEEAPTNDDEIHERVATAVQWEQPEGELWRNGIRLIINHFKQVKQVTWHGRGDYFATVMPDGQNRSVVIHQLSKRRSQLPFNKSKGLVQCVLFHPVRPIFFVATQKNIRVYDLAKQEIIKKLQSSSKWISSMAIHSRGDNLLVGTYDRKLLWFDLDLSTKPYKVLRFHATAIRGVAYHRHYPLFASGSDDRSIVVCHGMVYNDLLQNPLVVPLKKLMYHQEYDDFGVFDVEFHPTQPWVFSSGADSKIHLYT